MKICKFSLYKARTTKDLQKEEDETPQLACTLQLQHLNKKGGGENIVPQPGMKVVKKKTNLVHHMVQVVEWNASFMKLKNNPSTMLM